MTSSETRRSSSDGGGTDTAEHVEPVCCPPQKTADSAIKNKVPHPVSEKTGIELKGKIEKVGNFDEVYVVSVSPFVATVGALCTRLACFDGG